MMLRRQKMECETACRQLPGRAEDWIAELTHTRAYLNPDQRYAGSCILVYREHVREITDLTPSESEGLWNDVRRMSAAIQSVVRPHKLNVALLGNLVPHLHAHIIARQTDDSAWPNAIWSVALPPVAATANAKADRIAALRRSL